MDGLATVLDEGQNTGPDSGIVVKDTAHVAGEMQKGGNVNLVQIAAVDAMFGPLATG